MRSQLSLLLLSPWVLVAAISNPLPTVDLGYATHRATSYNETTDSYTFANIRFAAPPTGSLRFAPPAPPMVDRSTVQDGKVDYYCHQAGTARIPLQPNLSGVETEDCLFLDVIVPRAVFEGRAGHVPVLFWIYGGGNISGAKKSYGDPALLLPESPRPVVYVQTNYRLGAFGFLAGPSFTLSPNTVPNAGLYDQMFALEWVQKYIVKFGGNKDEVTVMGVSAGAGGIMHLITAFGGHTKKLFNRAIPMSTGLFPTSGHATSEVMYKEFESRAGCSDIACLRAASAETLHNANAGLVAAAMLPRIGPGPVIDGNLVPDIPDYLFLQGRFRNDIDILVSGDIDEGSMFTNASETNFDDAIRKFFPAITPSGLATIQTFYPEQNYPSVFSRLTAVTSDVRYNCHGLAMASSSSPTAKRYRMLTNIPPGTHGTGALTLIGYPLATPELLKRFRRFVMNFVVFGDPNGRDGGVGGGVVFPEFKAGGNGLEISAKDIKISNLSGNPEVCRWWAKGLYWP